MMVDEAETRLPLLSTFGADHLVDGGTSSYTDDRQVSKRTIGPGADMVFLDDGKHVFTHKQINYEDDDGEHSTTGNSPVGDAAIGAGGLGTARSRRLIGNARHCVSELVATAIFVFIGTMSVATKDILIIALVHGLIVSLLIVAFADMGGAHMNPVVTLADVLITGDRHWGLSFVCVIMQLTGGIAGAAITRGVLSYTPHGTTTSKTTVYESIRGGSNTLGSGVTAIRGILLEAVLTFILVLVVLLVATDRTWHHRHLAFSVGFTVFAEIAVGATITGGSMNPARSFGPAVVVTDLDVGVWTNHYVYWVGPITGSCVAVLVFRFIFGGAGRKTSAERQQQRAEDEGQFLMVI